MMPQFRPTRASSPSKAPRRLENAVEKIAADLSRTSTNASLPVPELTGLTHDEIELLDAVIDRAGPDATTFLSVFTAYNHVLRERGFDPQEVVYYGKLLKLGTMKGKNWAAKWNAVKAHQNHPIEPGYNDQVPTRPQRTNHAPKRNIYSRASPHLTEDTLSLDTRVIDDGEVSSSSFGPSISMSTKRLEQRSQARTITSNSRNDSSSFRPSRAAEDSPYRPRTDSIATTEISDDDDTDTLFAAPSSASRNVQTSSRAHRFPIEPEPVTTAAAARKAIASAREGRGSVVNEEEAWKKIRMERDEAEADAFRETRLLERCWDAWSQMYHWIVTTNEQLAEARDNLVVRIHFQKWRNVIARRAEIWRHAAAQSDNRRLKKALTTWISQSKERKQIKWRQDMRTKMKMIRTKRELKLRKSVWDRWRQLSQLQLLHQLFNKRLVHRFYDRWKQRLSTLNNLELIADDAFQGSQERVLARFWDRWRTSNELQVSGHIISEQIKLRLMSNAISLWRNCLIASEFHEVVLMKASLASWKSSRVRLRTLEARALKHIVRQDGVLLRAVFRVWKARKQGKALERLKTSNLICAAWSVWKQQLQQSSRNKELAMAFALRANSTLSEAMLRKWHEVYSARQKILSIALKHDAAQTYSKALLKWQTVLRRKAEEVELASVAQIFFATRHAWRAWYDAMNERARTRRLLEFQKRHTAKSFYSWLNRSRRLKQLRLAEETTRNSAKKRLLRNALLSWMRCVVAMKERHWDMAKRSDAALQLYILVYLLVKKEGPLQLSSENIRRVFIRWLGLARISRHRRVTLKAKEDEIKLSVIACAWDKWRDRLTVEKLRPISLPALRFHATNAKAKYFEIWRQAMPRALQSTKAREMDRKIMLEKHLTKWVQTHRTKMALRAVAIVLSQTSQISSASHCCAATSTPSINDP
ncbi:hypothetical protein H0H92_002629 [Tricholoma furcatifolium]|nr:hypothetical protein H0H92_002629 [Tricholoma furcatifolium]